MDESNADPKPIAEISHGPSAFEQFLDKNQKLLIAIGIVLAIAAGAYVVKDGIDQGARKDGGMALVGAESSEDLQGVLEQHAGVPAAGSAAVLLSDRQWEEGQQSASIETLRADISQRPEHPATIPARARLAARLREMGETSEAKTEFEYLAGSPAADWIAPYALVSLAEIARSEGDTGTAESYLEEARSKYPDTAFSKTVQAATRFVDFKMPTEIDPPAPAPVEDASLPEPPSMDAGAMDGSANPLLDSFNTPPDTTGLTPEEPVEEPAEPAAEENENDAPPSGE